MLNVIMLMEKFSKHDYNSEANDLIVLLFVFIKQKTKSINNFQTGTAHNSNLYTHWRYKSY